MMMEKASCKSMAVVLAEAWHARKANKYAVCLFQEEQNTAPSMIETIQYNQPATSSLSVTLGTGATLGARCRSLLPVDWARRAG